VDDQAKYEALKSEFEAEPAQLVRSGAPAKVVYIRAFQDEGGLVRLDLGTEPEDEEHLQLVMGREKLMALLADPQQLPPE
jgi:hypothetical protein